MNHHTTHRNRSMVYALGDRQPTLIGRHFIAPGAVVIGDVTLGNDVSVWFNAVIRGDNAPIVIGDGSNVQECSVLHVDEGVPLSIGEYVTIGHKVMLHGCTIGDGSLIGMNAVVLNHAVVGKNCLIGANALVTEGMVVPDNSLVLGSPAKTVKALSKEALAELPVSAKNYIDKIEIYSRQLKTIAE